MPHTPPTLSAEQLAELLGLLKKVDSVELKLTVPATNLRRLMRALDVDPLDAQIRQVVFFDTPDLALNEAGVVVRAPPGPRGGRRLDRQAAAGGARASSRPRSAAARASASRSTPCPVGSSAPGSMVNDMGPSEVREVLLGDKPIKKLFTKEQRSFYEAHAPDGLDMNQLSMLGPITVFKLKWKPKDFPRRIVGEVWQYPDGSRILELSTKCAPSEMFQAAAESRAFLHAKGVDVGGEQTTKTRTALEFFSGELTSEDQSA